MELVDEVAAVGEDEDAAGPRRLDEAERGDALAGAGGVLEPEPAGGVRILGRGLAMRPETDEAEPMLVAAAAVPVAQAGEEMAP